MTYFSLTIAPNCLAAKHFAAPLLHLFIVPEEFDGLQKPVSVQKESCHL